MRNLLMSVARTKIRASRFPHKFRPFDSPSLSPLTRTIISLRFHFSLSGNELRSSFALITCNLIGTLPCSDPEKLSKRSTCRGVAERPNRAGVVVITVIAFLCRGHRQSMEAPLTPILPTRSAAAVAETFSCRRSVINVTSKSLLL